MQHVKNRLNFISPGKQNVNEHKHDSEMIIAQFLLAKKRGYVSDECDKAAPIGCRGGGGIDALQLKRARQKCNVLNQNYVS